MKRAGGKGNRDGMRVETRPEGLAYKQASPLTRAGETGDAGWGRSGRRVGGEAARWLAARWARASAAEVAVVVGGAAEAAVGEEGVGGDIAGADPAKAFVEASGVAAGDGVEDEECACGFDSRGFGGTDECGAESLAAGAAVDEHFDEVGAVGLVFGEVEEELDGAAYAAGIFGDDDAAAAGGDVFGDAAPEGESAVAREGVHEADGGAAFDAIDEEIGELVEVGIGEGVEAAGGVGGDEGLGGGIGGGRG